MLTNPFRSPERRKLLPPALQERVRLCPFVFVAAACATFAKGIP